RSVMAMLRAEAAAGRTIVLTTQILSEAEELCDDILIINNGRRVARGSVHALKELVGRLHEVTITFDHIPQELATIVAGYGPERVVVRHNTAPPQLRDEEPQILELVSALGTHGRLPRPRIRGTA